MKKILVFILLLIVGAAIGYYLYSDNQTNFTKDASAYKAVPISAPIFLEVSSAREFISRHQILNGLAETGIGGNWFAFLEEADSLIGVTDQLSKRLLDTPFIITWGVSGRDDLDPLVIMKADTDVRKENLNSFIQIYFTAPGHTFKEREYGNYIINEIYRGRGKEPLYYSFTEDLFLISRKSIIIEQVILQLTTKGITNDRYFTEVNQAAGFEGIQVYINHNRMDGIFSNLLSRKVTERMDEFGLNVRFQPLTRALKFTEFAGWSEFDARFDNRNLLLSGTMAADDSLNHFLSIFDQQQPVRLKAADVLPVNTSFFCSYAISDKDAFFQQLEDYFRHTSDYYHREERMKRFDRGIRNNIRKLFMDIVKDELIVGAGTIPVNTAGKTVYFIVPVSGRSAAEEQINKLINAHASASSKEVSEYTTDFTIDNELRYPIYKFPYPSFPGLWLGSPYTMAQASFVTFYNNTMVFSNTETGLHEYLRNMITGLTLGNDKRYQNFRQKNNKRTNINVFVDVNKIFGYRNEVLAESIVKMVNSREENVRKFDRINWQIQKSKSNYTSDVTVSYQSDPGKEAKTTWQSVIGNNIVAMPYLMKNHTSQGDKDIVFQDAQNNLLQVSPSGRVRWNVTLPGKILSEIHQIDYYRNGRLQYLFNTHDKLYLIDRNGNNVAHFPVVLPSMATNGVSVFDYDKNRNYRFFIAGADQKIYAFDHEGMTLKGWVFDKTESEVTTPLVHFKVDSKDYIVIKDKMRVYILDRQGEERIPVSVRFQNSRNSLMLIRGDRPKIAGTDANGKVYYLYFDGSVEEKKTARFSDHHYFTIDDLDGNSIQDFIFVDGNELTVMDEHGKKRFTRKFNSASITKPMVYAFQGDSKKIGMADPVSNQIYLINADGKMHDGFPLQGNSEYTIGKLTETNTGLNLIVGSEGGILYNYTLQE